MADASAVYTRSISIAAPPAEVWPWLVQMGQDKAGFYSFDWAETLFTDPMRNASTIHPEWQQLELGVKQQVVDVNGAGIEVFLTA